jgi:hypothetical protein
MSGRADGQLPPLPNWDLPPSPSKRTALVTKTAVAVNQPLMPNGLERREAQYHVATVGRMRYAKLKAFIEWLSAWIHPPLAMP